jgi:hypothetical protein
MNLLSRSRSAKKILPFLFLQFIFCQIAFSQSSSVFDATYFNKADNIAPPLKVGKGFHINDVYKQTRSCFTQESSKKENLTSQSTGGKTTTLKIYQTTTNEKYYSFKSK